MSDPREKAHKFLMENSAVYRVMHSPRYLVGCALGALILSAVIIWALP